jgi:hypothetical protein
LGIQQLLIEVQEEGENFGLLLLRVIGLIYGIMKADDFVGIAFNSLYLFAPRFLQKISSILISMRLIL